MLNPRQTIIHEPYYHHDSFWWSPAGYVAKWTIVGAIFLLFLAWVLGGHLHARHRVRHGRPPLRYHRWLLPRAYRSGPRTDVYYHAQPYGWGEPPHGEGRAYPMHGYYAEPPPVYSSDIPPTYQPPPGATKTNPDQSARGTRGSPPLPTTTTTMVRTGDGPAGTNDERTPNRGGASQGERNVTAPTS